MAAPPQYGVLTPRKGKDPYAAERAKARRDRAALAKRAAAKKKRGFGKTNITVDVPSVRPLGPTTKNPILRAQVKKSNRQIRDKVLAAEIGRVIDPFARQAAPGIPGQVLRSLAGSILPGPGIAKKLKGEDAAAWELALDAALFPLPFKGLPTATTGALRAARGFGKGKKLGEALDEPILKRSLRLGDKVQQLPSARSRVTRTVIEKPADLASQAMMGEGKVARAARRVLPTASAERRVPKAAGMQEKQRAIRARARKFDAMKALPKEGSPEDVAHFWWAQLPKALRNVTGLARVRATQAKELADLTSGRTFAALKQQKPTEKVKLAISDLPILADDLSLSLAQLDEVIAKPPTLNPRIIEAVRELSEDHQAIFEAAGKLLPEDAAARKGLVSRWLELEPDAAEVYIGHRLGKVRGARESTLPVSPGTGRVRLPQGVAQQNRGVLIRQGRVRASTHVAAEDWQAAQGFSTATNARKDLWLMGRPLAGPYPEKIPSGYRIINLKGKVIPAHWDKNKLSDIALESEEELEQSAKEILSTFMAGESDSQLLKQWALPPNGATLDDLRILPKSTVDRYYSQFTPAPSTGPALKVYDAAVDVTAASIIFARLGYIPKNIVQNLVMAVPHQGVYFLFNAPRAMQALKNPKLRHLLSAEVGTGATGALAEEARFAGKLRGAPRKATSAVTAVADTPLRISAFFHEAAAAGVIPKYKFVLSAEDEAKILDFLTNPAHEAKLNDVRSPAVEAMADFSRLTPKQARFARRVLVIPGWLWAGSRYPFHFAATHPGRSAAMAYLAAGEPGAPEELQFNKPLDEYFAKNLPKFVEGIETPWGVERTTSLSPVSTPWEIVGAAAGTDWRTVADYGNPLATSLYNMANRTVGSPSGPYRTDYLTSIQRNLERLVPNYSFVRDLISPPESPRNYPEDASRLGRFKRELGIVPIEITREVAPEARIAEGIKADRLELEAKIELAGLPPSFTRAGRKAWARREKLYLARSEIDSGLEGEQYQREALRVEYKLARKLGLRPIGGERATAYFAASPAARQKITNGWSADNILKLRRELSYYVFGGKTLAVVREEVGK